MPNDNPVNWQPIREMPLTARMIDGALEDTREHLEMLSEARVRRHVLDDATLDRVEQVHTEQLQFVDIGSVRNLGRYAASWMVGWPNRPSSTAALT